MRLAALSSRRRRFTDRFLDLPLQLIKEWFSAKQRRQPCRVEIKAAQTRRRRQDKRAEHFDAVPFFNGGC